MPRIQAITDWFAVNGCNDTSVSGITDRTTGVVQYIGDLDYGVWFDMTEFEANNNSFTTTGLLHFGRYRRVQVAAGATAGNVKLGTLAFANAGPSVQGVTILTAGSGQTPGTYTVASSGGGGTGATIQVVIAAGGTLTVATVLTPGTGYTSAPTFTVAAGGTPGTVQAQMLYTPDIVTSQDQAYGLASGVSPFCAGVFLNVITPGNFGFIQELGLATVLGAASFTGTPGVGSPVQTKTGGAGTADVLSVNGALTPIVVGYAVDLPTVSVLWRAKLTLPYTPQ